MTSERRRVVVTGIGAITPIGSSVQGLWNGIRSGRSAVAGVSRFDASQFRSRMAAEVHDFDPLNYMDLRAARRLDRFAQFGVVASLQALEDAQLKPSSSLEACHPGVSIGSALGGVAYGEEQHELFLRSGIKAVSPQLALAVYGGATGGNIAIHLRLRGPNLANANSCASGVTAIGEAMRLIQRGEADIMLAGGVEAPLAPLTFGAFSLIKAMSARNDEPATASRPFDTGRDGFVMAEGAAIMILESLEVAQKRGVRIYAELLGYAQTNDAYHMTAPRPDGSEAGRAISSALNDACVRPESVDYINAHATGTPLGDVAEALAIATALGPDSAKRVPVSGTKGLYGHALGASGAIEACITALALTHGFLPGTTNLSQAEPDCALRLIPPQGLCTPAECAVTTSFGFGGTNAALVIRRFDG